jgi:hypothetical protein
MGQGVGVLQRPPRFVDDKRLKVRRPARLNGDERFSDGNFRNFGRERGVR